jgi:hypothetical protein
MHSDWFNGIDILQGRWQHEEKVGYCYPSGLEKTLCKWEVYIRPAGHERVKHLKTVNCDYLLVTMRTCEMAPLCLELIILLYYFLSCKINGHCVHFSSFTKVNILNTAL